MRELQIVMRNAQVLGVPEEEFVGFSTLTEGGYFTDMTTCSLDRLQELLELHTVLITRLTPDGIITFTIRPESFFYTQLIDVKED